MPDACERCGGRTQPETVIRVHHTLRGTRAVSAPGWYCWTCKTGARAPAVAPRVPAVDLAEWLRAIVCGLRLRRARAC
jgi:hypothetical protein